MAENIVVKRKVLYKYSAYAISYCGFLFIFIPLISYFFLDSENQNQPHFLQIALWKVLVLGVHKTIPICFQIFISIHL